MKLSVVRTNKGRLFQTVGAQHENRRAAMFVDEDCALKSVQRKDSWVEGDTGLRECQPVARPTIVCDVRCVE